MPNLSQTKLTHHRNYTDNSDVYEWLCLRILDFTQNVAELGDC
ncbi:hypothetical protein [Nostoc sp. C117]